jgi:hypothetical protein
MDNQNEQKHPHKPDPDNMPNYSLPIDIEVFRRLFHEAYTDVLTDFVDEVDLKNKITRKVQETLDEVLDNHVNKITRRHLNA